ncbi:MAG: peptidase M3, partial [Phenylobacterium zucineum]
MRVDIDNPFAVPSGLPFELPDFAAIRDEHYQPAIEAGIAEHLAELAAIAAETEPATVANVIEAWESSGRLLTRALNAFYTKQPADTNDVLDAVDAAVAPQLAEHSDAIYLDHALYGRVASLATRVEAGEIELDPASAYWLERCLLAFERAGVNLPDADQARLRALNHRIAELQSEFGRKALAGMNAGAVLVTDEAELDGLSPAEVAGARDRATDRGHESGWLIELDNTSGQRPLDVLKNRELRRRIHLAAVNRGLGGEHDTRPLVVELARLRAERAELLGFANHAAYVAADGCARTGQAVWELLTTLAPAAVANARAEAAEMEQVWQRISPGEPLEAWDWQFV